MPVRRVVITDLKEINVYGDDLSYSGMMFTLTFDKIHQLVQEFKWETHTHTHTHTQQRRQHTRHSDYTAGWAVRGSNPSKFKRLSALLKVQTGSESHPTSYFVGTRDPSRR